MEPNQPKKINLAVIVCSLSYGGAERLVLDIINNLDKNLFNTHLITIMGGGELASEAEKLPIKIKLCHKKSKLGLMTIWKIKNYLQNEKIDIVHTHLFAGDTWGRLAAFLANTPVIISTEHNINLDENKFKKIIKKVLSLPTAKIIAVSDQVKDYQIKEEKIKPAKITVINNGLDLSRFPYQNNYSLSSPLNLGIIGRLEPQKGHEVAFKALQRLKDEGLKAELIIKGQGKLKNELQNLAEELKIEKQITWQEASIEVADFYQTIDLLLIPSKWEGFGLVALEAMASGVPVIASATGGLTGFIKDGNNGLLFPVGDWQALAEKIKLLSRDLELIEKISKAARLTVANNFNIQKTAQQYQDLYLKYFHENIIG